MAHSLRMTECVRMGIHGEVCEATGHILFPAQSGELVGGKAGLYTFKALLLVTHFLSQSST